MNATRKHLKSSASEMAVPLLNTIVPNMPWGRVADALTKGQGISDIHHTMGHRITPQMSALAVSFMTAVDPNWQFGSHGAMSRLRVVADTHISDKVMTGLKRMFPDAVRIDDLIPVRTRRNRLSKDEVLRELVERDVDLFLTCEQKGTVSDEQRHEANEARRHRRFNEFRVNLPHERESALTRAERERRPAFHPKQEPAQSKLALLARTEMGEILQSCDQTPNLRLAAAHSFPLIVHVPESPEIAGIVRRFERDIFIEQQMRRFTTVSIEREGLRGNYALSQLAGANTNDGLRDMHAAGAADLIASQLKRRVTGALAPEFRMMNRAQAQLFDASTAAAGLHFMIDRSDATRMGLHVDQERKQKDAFARNQKKMGDGPVQA